MSFESLQQLLLWRPPPVPEVIGSGLLYEGTKLVLFGEPKTFKSLLALQLALCVASGNPWIGFRTLRCRTAYLQAEVPKMMFRKRALKMAQYTTVPPDSVFFQTRQDWKLDRDSGIKALEHDLEALRPRLLIIDPVYKFLSVSDESSITRFLDHLDYLIFKLNLTIVLVHHSRKPRTALSGQTIDMGGSELRGPLFEQWADSILRLKGDILTDDRTLDFELRHAETLLTPLDLRLDRTRLWMDRV